MEDKVNFTLVGAFVLVLGMALVAGVLWLAAGITGQKPLQPYAAIMTESVAGLNLNAPVKYLSAEEGGVSHFQYGRDNVLLTWMHFRLLCGFVLRLPQLLAARLRGRAPFRRH